MINGVIYARFSSDMQREESIDAQVRACNEYASKHNINIIKVYSDEAKSAKNDKRPQFQKMMSSIEDTGAEIVLVHKSNRFARNMRDHLNYEYKLQEMGISLVSVSENFGEGKAAFLTKGINQLFSQYFLLDLAEEVKKGLRENALKALFNGGNPPYGYDIVDQHYVINENEAMWVRKLFKASLANEIKSVLDEMERMGVKTKRGNIMKYSTVYDMLRNEKYIGVYVFSLDGTRTRHADTSECIRIEDAIPPIIDKELFDLVQKMRGRRKLTMNNYLTKGLVYCECGNKMRAHIAKKRNEAAYYYCDNKKCPVKTISMDYIDDICRQYVKDLLSEETTEELGLYIARYRTSENQRVFEFNQMIRKQKSEKEKRMAALIDKLADPNFPQVGIASVGNEIGKLKEEIEALSEQTPPPALNENVIYHWIENIREDLNFNNIHNVIEKIEIGENKKVKITSTLTSLGINSPLFGGDTQI